MVKEQVQKILDNATDYEKARAEAIYLVKDSNAENKDELYEYIGETLRPKIYPESETNQSPPCDLCKEKPGHMWCHNDGGIGTPIRYGLNLHMCDDCYNNRKEEMEKLRREKMDENRRKCVESLKRQVWDNKSHDRSGMVHYMFTYWFKKEWKEIEEYEKYLGFELPQYFKDWINDCHCETCSKLIRKLTEEEGEARAKELNLPELGERPKSDGKEDWNTWYKANKHKLDEYDDKCRQWNRAFTYLFQTHKYLKELPKHPEHLSRVPFRELHDHPELYPENVEHRKAYDEYRASERNCYYCSQKCVDEARAKDSKLIQVLS